MPFFSIIDNRLAIPIPYSAFSDHKHILFIRILLLKIWLKILHSVIEMELLSSLLLFSSFSPFQIIFVNSCLMSYFLIIADLYSNYKCELCVEVKRMMLLLSPLVT